MSVPQRIGGFGAKVVPVALALVTLKVSANVQVPAAAIVALGGRSTKLSKSNLLTINVNLQWRGILIFFISIYE